MSGFIHDDFLLDTPMARVLFHDYAENQPIFDYHCHLPPEEIAQNHQFKDLWEIWLKGDHYKWRAMRANGEDEALCTGGASPREKFDAWARTVPDTIGNPLYHWTHLELRRPFGIDDILLSPSTADYVWNKGIELLSEPQFSARGIIDQMNVHTVVTVDDPVDDLKPHATAQADKRFKAKIVPCFRPDRICDIRHPDFVSYLEKLEEVSGVAIASMDDLFAALVQRMDHFAAMGCTISDHALDEVTFAQASDTELNAILKARRDGSIPSEHDFSAYRTALLVFLGREYHRREWAQQYHIGAYRNVNTRKVAEVGEACGFDSIHDQPIAAALGCLLDTLEQTDQLPRTILYCLNPRDNEMIAAMCGNFQDGKIPGKIQIGSGWWFNDQKDGMLRQMMQLANLGLLSRFVGMLTDSRSFLSYTRHEYFRRVLCQFIGHGVRDGEIPNDEALLGKMVKDICFDNAIRYFQAEK
ncbi:D-glucuronate isomerase [Cohaesibacter sp. ES.047]|uniref:glucuronate isomerase n=1 Tax=Cohaesibacter sp. ES.047 TaxID=1798205 RepID=UPI000BB8ACFF|nr:glucuronate isomerase [Cohaesibacter sp. ES.047]SNY90266.1 D-glucuronate isomerase [Cohaesibacter sp. ES.047]